MASNTVTNKKPRQGQRVTPTERAEQERVFLAELSQKPNVSAAARKAGVSRKTIYQWHQDKPDFAAAMDAALDAAIDDLEETAFTRAHDGSDVLTIFLLKSHRPERYRETSEQHTDMSITIRYANDWRGKQEVDDAQSTDGE